MYLTVSIPYAFVRGIGTENGLTPQAIRDALLDEDFTHEFRIKIVFGLYISVVSNWVYLERFDRF